MQVIAEHGKEMNSTACGSMPYADATVKEVLRIETIVGEVYRRALQTFECGGYTIPKVCCLFWGFDIEFACLLCCLGVSTSPALHS